MHPSTGSVARPTAASGARGPARRSDGALVAAPPKSSKAVAARKVEEVLRRMLPHSIAQAYDKVSAVLKNEALVAVNGSRLVAADHGQGSLRDLWAARKESPPGSTKTLAPAQTTHYARSCQYLGLQAGLSLRDTFKTLEVTVTSTSAGSTCQWFQHPSPVLSKMSWSLVCELDSKIGLALYDISLGPWKSSSLVALVWVKGMEVVNLYLLLHLAEVLYNCPPRTIRMLADDIDKKHGLHSYTAAITIRNFQQNLWEKDFFSVEFPVPERPGESVRVRLLDEQDCYKDRSRLIVVPFATVITTDAMSVNTELAIVVDFTLWDMSCHPVWGFSRLLPVTTQSIRHGAVDLSLSVAGERLPTREIVYRDTQRGNYLSIQLEKNASSSAKSRTLVKQIILELNTSFIDKTFGTYYNSASKIK